MINLTPTDVMTTPCRHLRPFFISLSLIFTTTVVALAAPIVDTLQHPVLARQEAIAAPTKLVRSVNVVYPAILEGQQAQTLAYIQDFAERRRAYIIRMHDKGKKLLPQAEKIFRQYQLPAELNMLLPLESAYQPKATSSAGAFGYWQFMDDVAKEYGLRYVPHYSAEERKKMRKENARQADSLFNALAKAKDDRAHFAKATRAAARYLHDRRRNLHNDWLLVVASYNCGVGNVWQALATSGKPNASFWDIHDLLPKETQAYVKNFIALNVIFANYDKFLKHELRFTEEVIELPDGFNPAESVPASL